MAGWKMDPAWRCICPTENGNVHCHANAMLVSGRLQKTNLTAGLPSNERCKGEIWRAPNPDTQWDWYRYGRIICMVDIGNNSIECLGKNSFKCHQGCRSPN